MAHVFLWLIGAIVVAAIAYGVAWVITGRDNGLETEEPDGRSLPLPTSRPLTEADIAGTRFESAFRGYRMDQVDAALRRAAYDTGYKQELISVLEMEIEALRDGRTEDADALRDARAGAAGQTPVATETAPAADSGKPGKRDRNTAAEDTMAGLDLTTIQEPVLDEPALGDQAGSEATEAAAVRSNGRR